MDVASAAFLPLVRVAALLVGTALPLSALPASAAPYPVPGVATITLTARAVEPVADARATPSDEGARCRDEAGALASGLRHAGMSPQGANYAAYLIAEECEEQGESC